LHRGLLEKQIERIKTAYRDKRDHMLAMIQQYFPTMPGLYWTAPHGGLFIWVTLPEHMDASEMFLAAVEQQVAYVSGAAFHPDGGGDNTFRLNFSYSSHNDIKEGIMRLGQVIAAWEEGQADVSLTTP